MRPITEHQTNPLNERIELLAGDPIPGGAPSIYLIRYSDSESIRLNFHVGDPAQGANGITSEVLIACVLDRLRGFDAGPFGTRDNSIAITHLEDALMRLQRRTQERIARGVEGQQVP